MKTYFSTPYRFAGMPDELSSYEKSRVVILPVPYDATTTYRSGTREGPRAIINASRFLPLYDEETGKLVGQGGICTLDEMDPVADVERMLERVYAAWQRLLQDGKKVVMIGGEHSLTAAAVKAAAEKWKNLSVLHIDAHLDMRSEEDGYDHSCVMQRCSSHAKIVSVGIRSATMEEADFAQQHATVFWDKDMRRSGDWIKEAVAALTDNVYVSLDLDGLDPAYMPAVGTPEPGGLSWQEFSQLITVVGSSKNVVAADVMELMPLSFHAPDFIAAKAVRKLIAAME